MPSHASAAQVIAAGGRRGDKEGNDRADELARKGAQGNALPRDLVRKTLNQKYLAT